MPAFLSATGTGPGGRPQATCKDTGGAHVQEGLSAVGTIEDAIL